MKTCEDYQPLISDYLDRELSSVDQQAVVRHLEDCSPCHQEMKVELKLKEILRAHHLPSMPSDLLATIESRTFRRASAWRPFFLATAAAFAAWCLAHYGPKIMPRPSLQIVQELPLTDHPRVALQGSCQDIPSDC